MKKQLIIVGAGAFARELLVWAKHVDAYEPIGFLDSNADALSPYKIDLPVLGDDSFKIPQGVVLACGLTAPELKLKVCRKLEKAGNEFVSIVHPSAIIGSDCRIGKGSVICPNVVMTTNVQVADFVTINMAVGIGHDVVLQDGVTINPGCQIGGKTTLEEGVFMGSMSAVLERLTVGKYARVGAGSVVVSRVPEGWTMMGVPARRLRLPGADCQELV